jgi:hypothetical protein
MSKRASGGGMGVFERQRHFLAAAANKDGNGAGSGRVEHTHARPDMGRE